MEILEKINAELEAFKTKRADLTKQLQAEFPQLLKPLFDQSTKIESVGWRQYTPYFNDGDECVFGVHNDDIILNGSDEDDDEKDIQWSRERVWDGKKYINNEAYDKAEGEILNQIKGVLSSIPDEFYKELFGDHVIVTVKRDGTIETDEYEHD